MKKRRSIKSLDREAENIKILKNFFEKSFTILENARKEARMKHPELFRAS